MIPQSVSQGKHISSFCIINLILITAESQWTNRLSNLTNAIGKENEIDKL